MKGISESIWHLAILALHGNAVGVTMVSGSNPIVTYYQLICHVVIIIIIITH
jgi:hypothetical protein